MLLKLKLIPTLLVLITFTITACSDGGGGTAEEQATDNLVTASGSVSSTETTSTLVANSTQRLQNDLEGFWGLSKSQAEGITNAAYAQLRADGLSNSNVVNEVLPSLLNGAIKGIGATLTGETLVNETISQSIATMMAVVGEAELNTFLSSARSTALSASLQSLLEKLVETAVIGLDQLSLSDHALQMSVDYVIRAVVTNLDKTMVEASDVSLAIESIAKSATSSLAKLDVSDSTKRGLKTQVSVSMEMSIDEWLASSDNSLGINPADIKQSATSGIEAGASNLFDSNELEEPVVIASSEGIEVGASNLFDPNELEEPVVIASSKILFWDGYLGLSESSSIQPFSSWYIGSETGKTSIKEMNADGWELLELDRVSAKQGYLMFKR